MDDLLDNPLLSDITYERVINYFIRFIQIVGVPNMFQDKVQDIIIKDYKGLIPNDFYEVIQVRYENQPMRYATDTFHLSPNKSYDVDYTFMIQGGVIHTSLEAGTVEMAYRSIFLDELGYPQVQDNGCVIRALEAFIKVQQYTILFDSGKISIQVLSNAKQDYAWAVGACQTDLLKLDLSKAESFYNSITTLIPRNNEFMYSFKNNGSKEIIRRQ